MYVNGLSHTLKQQQQGQQQYWQEENKPRYWPAVWQAVLVAQSASATACPSDEAARMEHSLPSHISTHS